VKVLIVGDGERREQLHRLAAELGLRNVIFAGHQRDVADYLHALDVFVLPSLWEGLPVSVLEAMACSLPVVATRVSGTPEVVEDGITGRLVEPRDAAGLLSAITALVADAGLRRRMGDAGRKRVEREFSAESMLASTEEVYRDLVRD
jgi:glycosyltransferase involved in cell wall biosynthesis